MLELPDWVVQLIGRQTIQVEALRRELADKTAVLEQLANPTRPDESEAEDNADG